MKKKSGKILNLNGKIIDHKGTVYLIRDCNPTHHRRMSWMKRVVNLELMKEDGEIRNLVVGLGSNGWRWWDASMDQLVRLEILL